MTESSRLNLAAGRLRLTLDPSVGGSIARFDWHSADGEKIAVLWGVEGHRGSVLDYASFPLVPFCNRIRDGTFRFRNRNVTLARNMEGDPSPLHGQGWLRRWDVVAATKQSAELLFRHEAGEWPWDYEARQRFDLDEQGLTVDLSCTNLADEPMPCGLGQHPYFPCSHATRLDTGVASVWTIDEQVLPVEKVPAAGRYDLRNRQVCGQDLDNGFGGWNGRARIDDPALPFGIELSSTDAAYFQLYSPSTGRLFVAEPVSHANAALNEPEGSWPDLGLRILEPGETMSLAMRLEIIASSSKG